MPFHSRAPAPFRSAKRTRPPPNGGISHRPSGATTSAPCSAATRMVNALLMSCGPSSLAQLIRAGLLDRPVPNQSKHPPVSSPRQQGRFLAALCRNLAQSRVSSLPAAGLRTLRRRTRPTRPRWPAVYSPRVSTVTPFRSYPTAKDRVTVIGQRARCPGFVALEFLDAILLNLETQVNTAEELNGLLNMRAIFRIDADVAQDLV